MHPEYERGVARQNRLLLEMLKLDRDAEEFDEQFDRLVAELIAVTKDVDRLMQSNPGIRRALAL